MAAGRQADGDGPRLFEVGTLVDALVDSEERTSYLYKFLKLLEDGIGVAGDVRDKLAAVDLDEGTYPPATQGQVKPALAKKRKAVRAAKKKREAEEDAAAAAATTSSRRTRRGPLFGN